MQTSTSNLHAMWKQKFRTIIQAIYSTELDGDVARLITRNVMNLHFCRRFITNMADPTPKVVFLYNTDIHTLWTQIGDPIYGLPLKQPSRFALSYSKLPISLRCSEHGDFRSDEDMATFMAKTDSHDRIYITPTLYTTPLCIVK